MMGASRLFVRSYSAVSTSASTNSGTNVARFRCTAANSSEVPHSASRGCPACLISRIQDAAKHHLLRHGASSTAVAPSASLPPQDMETRSAWTGNCSLGSSPRCGRCVITSAEACCKPQPTGRKTSAADHAHQHRLAPSVREPECLRPTGLLLPQEERDQDQPGPLKAQRGRDHSRNGRPRRFHPGKPLHPRPQQQSAIGAHHQGRQAPREGLSGQGLQTRISVTARQSSDTAASGKNSFELTLAPALA